MRRNPWNEVECGSHYARALASWSVLMTLSGYRYSAIDQHLAFSPVMNSENFRCFYAAGPAWGVYSQQTQDSSQAIRLEVSHGELLLRYVGLTCGVGSEKISVSNLRGAGQRVDQRVQAESERCECATRPRTAADNPQRHGPSVSSVARLGAQVLFLIKNGSQSWAFVVGEAANVRALLRQLIPERANRLPPTAMSR